MPVKVVHFKGGGGEILKNISEKYEISRTEQIHVNLGPLAANRRMTSGKVVAAAWIVNKQKF